MSLENETLLDYYRKQGSSAFNELLADYETALNSIDDLEKAVNERDELIEKLSKK